MPGEITHISVCICTFKRPEFLKRLLTELDSQETDGQFTYSVVVVDNDRLQSAKAVVSEFAAVSQLRIGYHVEPEQNIALARNRAVANAFGGYVAFIDDDEFPVRRWLLTLFEACNRYSVDGVLGPVKPHFDHEPPTWVVKGKFYERRTYPTGLVIDGQKGRTGNVLLRSRIFTSGVQAFRPEHRTGEDQEFFGRMIEKGHVFIWCNEAVAYEIEPPVRWKRTFMLRRALLRGAFSRLDRDFGVVNIVKSIIAVPAYIAILPVTPLLGQHWLMRCLDKLFYHVGRLLALLGINPIRAPYVTE